MGLCNEPANNGQLSVSKTRIALPRVVTYGPDWCHSRADSYICLSEHCTEHYICIWEALPRAQLEQAKRRPSKIWLKL